MSKEANKSLVWMRNTIVCLNSLVPDFNVEYDVVVKEEEIIRKALDNTTLIEKLEGMKKSYSMRNISQEYNEGYNQAIQDAIELVKEQGNE